MDRVLQGLQWQICLVYLDDVIIYSTGITAHIHRLEQVLQRIHKAGLKLKPKKCKLFQTEVLYLGHVVSEAGIATDPEKVKAVQDWGEPSAVTEVRSFLGLCSYYRKFIPNFSAIAKPLTKLTEKEQEFKWGVEQEDAWRELKSRLIHAPVLAYPDPTVEFILDTDASAYGIGAVISQVQDDVEKVIAYGSRTLTKEERRYCVTRRELLAVVYFVKHFRHYLYGHTFTVRTDHGALRWLINFKDPQGQVARWLEVLGTYDFRIEHRAGIKHNNADALSRKPCSQCQRQHPDNIPENRKARVVTRQQVRDQLASIPTPDTLPPQPIANPWIGNGLLHIDNIKKEQKNDPLLSKLFIWKENDKRPEWNEISAEGTPLKSYWAQWDSLKLEQGVWYRVLCLEGKKTRRQILVPATLKTSVLQQLHNAVTAGHMGIRRTLSGIRMRFFWHGMRNDIQDWCRKCSVCAARKPPGLMRKAPLKKYQVGVPMERVALDVLGPLPLSRDGNRYVLVVSDYFTKWAEAYAIPDQEAKTVATAFVNQFVSRFGAPLLVHTDQGRNFEAKLFQEMCVLLGAKKTRTTSYHPQSDGMVERLNRTLGTMISAYVTDNQRTWDQHLSMLTMAYRATPHESTGLSPNEMMLGRETHMPVDVMVGLPPAESRLNETEYVENLRKCLGEAYEHARNHLDASANRQKQYYDLGARGKPFQPGDLVWFRNKDRRKGVCPKLQKKWKGPAIVEDRLNDVTYRLRLNEKDKKVLHFDMLKPYESSPTPKWVEKFQRKFQEKVAKSSKP